MQLTDKIYNAPSFDSRTFLNVVCYKNQKHNLLSLRDIVTDSGLVTLLDRFAGAYVRFPTASHTLETANLIYLYQLYQDLKVKAGKTIIPWQEAETRFINFAKKMGMDYLKAKKKCKEMNVMIIEANAWVSNVKAWENRNSPKKD